jgi:hypothetical protein
VSGPVPWDSQLPLPDAWSQAIAAAAATAARGPAPDDAPLAAPLEAPGGPGAFRVYLWTPAGLAVATLVPELLALFAQQAGGPSGDVLAVPVRALLAGGRAPVAAAGAGGLLSGSGGGSGGFSGGGGGPDGSGNAAGALSSSSGGGGAHPGPGPVGAHGLLRPAAAAAVVRDTGPGTELGDGLSGPLQDVGAAAAAAEVDTRLPVRPGGSPAWDDPPRGPQAPLSPPPPPPQPSQLRRSGSAGLQQAHRFGSSGNLLLLERQGSYWSAGSGASGSGASGSGGAGAPGRPGEGCRAVQEEEGSEKDAPGDVPGSGPESRSKCSGDEDGEAEEEEDEEEGRARTARGRTASGRSGGTLSAADGCEEGGDPEEPSLSFAAEVLVVLRVQLLQQEQTQEQERQGQEGQEQQEEEQEQQQEEEGAGQQQEHPAGGTPEAAATANGTSWGDAVGAAAGCNGAGLSAPFEAARGAPRRRGGLIRLAGRFRGLGSRGRGRGGGAAALLSFGPDGGARDSGAMPVVIGGGERGGTDVFSARRAAAAERLLLLCASAAALLCCAALALGLAAGPLLLGGAAAANAAALLAAAAPGTVSRLLARASARPQRLRQGTGAGVLAAAPAPSVAPPKSLLATFASLGRAPQVPPTSPLALRLVSASFARDAMGLLEEQVILFKALYSSPALGAAATPETGAPAAAPAGGEGGGGFGGEGAFGEGLVLVSQPEPAWLTPDLRRRFIMARCVGLRGLVAGACGASAWRHARSMLPTSGCETPWATRQQRAPLLQSPDRAGTPPGACPARCFRLAGRQLRSSRRSRAATTVTACDMQSTAASCAHRRTLTSSTTTSATSCWARRRRATLCCCCG